MIQQAFISGQLGRAIYTENDQRLVLSIDDRDRPRQCTGHDAGMFFHSGAQYSLVPSVEDLEQLANSLDRETRAYTAFGLILSSLDPDLTATRGPNIEAAEELLGNEAVYAFVRRRLMARTLPASADIDGASVHARGTGAPILCALLDAVQESQTAIKVVLQAWQNVTADFFSSEQEAHDAEISLIELGILEEIVSAVQLREYEKLSPIIVQYGLARQVSLAVPRASHLLNGLKNELQMMLDYAPDRAVSAEKRTVAKDRKSMKELLSGFNENKDRPSNRGLSAHEAKSRVNTQIEQITRLIHAHNISVAEKWLRDLIQFHARHSEKEHLAKSLCAVATVAMENHESSFAEVLVGHAVSLGIEDPVIFSLKARILSHAGRHQEALAEYDDAIQRFRHNAYIHNGRAEVLKAMGRFDEALAAFDQTISLFPNDEVAHTGRAEVLKAMGRFEDALAAFDQTVELFPGNGVAHNGRAEVLKAMGRFEDALAVFDRTRDLFPTDVFAHTGRAEVLKAMGRFEDALALFDQTVDLFPGNEVAHTGRAEVLKAMGRFEDALAAFDRTRDLFPTDVFAHTTRAEVLKAMGRFEDALAAYDQTVKLFPGNEVAHAGRAEVLKTMGHFDEALTAYRETRDLFPSDKYALCGYAAVLLLMDRTEEVKALLAPPQKAPVSRDDWVLYHIGAMMHIKSGDLDEAIRRLSHGVQHVPWQGIRPVFVNALAVALIKRQEYKNALNVLQPDIDGLDTLEKQKRLVLIGHSHAAIGESQAAIKSLSGLSDAKDPNVVSLRDFLRERYSLEERQAPKPSNLVRLDIQIAQKEFLIALAA